MPQLPCAPRPVSRTISRRDRRPLRARYCCNHSGNAGHALPRAISTTRAWRQSEPPDHGSLECRARARLHHPVSGSSPAAPDRAGTSSRPVPRVNPPARPPDPPPRSARSSTRSRPEHPRCHGPARRRGARYLHDRSCRRARRSGKRAPSSPCGTAFSAGSGSSQVLPGSSPITLTSPSSKAHQKSGPFAPPALPGLDARTTLSDSRLSRRPLRR